MPGVLAIQFPFKILFVLRLIYSDEFREQLCVEKYWHLLFESNIAESEKLWFSKKVPSMGFKQKGEFNFNRIWIQQGQSQLQNYLEKRVRTIKIQEFKQTLTEDTNRILLTQAAEAFWIAFCTQGLWILSFIPYSVVAFRENIFRVSIGEQELLQQLRCISTYICACQCCIVLYCIYRKLKTNRCVRVLCLIY